MLEMKEPKVFSVYAEVAWDKKTGGFIKTRKGVVAKIDIPKEFKGLGRYSCPDELFISSIAACLLTTFLYFKNKMQLKLLNLSVNSKGTVIKEPDGYELKNVYFNIVATTKKEYKEAAMKCLNLSEEYCHLLKLLPNAKIKKHLIFR
ncbi:OsmC family protein [Candidatus Bathyarchaeota archaeon]|nr:OsmC family protein [Candidatus Bathyarchaeota archaeon]